MQDGTSAATNATVPPVRNLRITFWGVQGSCPVFPTAAELASFDPRAAADVSRFGGDTTCVEVQTGDGATLLFDLGTGARACSDAMLARRRNGDDAELHVFGSHHHLDHRSGVSFASFTFTRAAAYRIHVYGPRRLLQMLDDRFGVFSRTVGPGTDSDDPLDYRAMTASFLGTELGPLQAGTTAPGAKQVEGAPWGWHPIGDPIQIGATTVLPFEVYHGNTPCIAYRVSHGGKSFLFCTDHEQRRGPDPADPRQQRADANERAVVEHSAGADAAYYDGQYLRAEYDGRVGIGVTAAAPRMDWGHSCIEDVVARAARAGVKRTLIGHHDPSRPWGERRRIDERLRGLAQTTVELAKTGTVIDL